MFYRNLSESSRYVIDYQEGQTLGDISPGYDFYAINYHPVTMASLETHRLRELGGLSLAFVLEMRPNDPFVCCPTHFDGYCVPDPTLTHPNPRVFAFPRPLQTAPEHLPAPPSEIPVIGSFGFATPGKGFEKVIAAVNSEFSLAVVRLNIPHATYADWDRSVSRFFAQQGSSLAKPGIEVRVTHDYMTQEELTAWCAANTLNCFLYDRDMTGLSATTDQAIIAGRPMSISGCDVFRHIHPYIAPYPLLTLREAIASTGPAVQRMREDWSRERFVRRFEFVLESYGLPI
jgi:hypothetical protein